MKKQATAPDMIDDPRIQALAHLHRVRIERVAGVVEIAARDSEVMTQAQAGKIADELMKTMKLIRGEIQG